MKLANKPPEYTIEQWMDWLYHHLDQYLARVIDDNRSQNTDVEKKAFKDAMVDYQYYENMAADKLRQYIVKIGRIEATCAIYTLCGNYSIRYFKSAVDDFCDHDDRTEATEWGICCYHFSRVLAFLHAFTMWAHRESNVIYLNRGREMSMMEPFESRQQSDIDHQRSEKIRLLRHYEQEIGDGKARQIILNINPSLDNRTMDNSFD